MSDGKFNVLLSAYSCEPFRGTESGAGWNWAYELARVGHTVHVVTRPIGRAGIEAFLAQSPTPNLRMIYIDSPHLSLRFGAIRPILECFCWQWSALATARKICQNIDIDVVHHVTWGSLHVGSKLWKLGKPFVFGPVGGGQTVKSGFRRYLRGGWLIEMLRSTVVRRFTGLLFSAKSTVSHAGLVFVTNVETGEWARRLGAPRVEAMMDIGVPRSMLAQEGRSPSSRRPFRILWVGRLVPRKALLLALEALSEISPTIDFTCTIVGDGPQGRYLPGWIEELRLGHRVTWRGQMDWDEVIRVYEDHHVFLFTSLRDTGGTQLVEAMSKGLPIVTLDHQGAHAAVPTEAGIKIPVKSPKQTISFMAQALERLAREPDTLARMGKAARERASELTWDQKAEPVSTLYPQVIADFYKHAAR